MIRLRQFVTKGEKNMKRLSALLLIFVLFLTLATLPGCCSAKSADKLEGAGFPTPEAAVEAYVQYMNEGNVAGMLSCFAIETFVDSVDTKEYLTVTGSVWLGAFQAIPASNPYAQQLLAAGRYSELIQRLYRQYYVYSFRDTEYENVVDGKSIKLTDEALVDEFLAVAEASPVGTWAGNVVLDDCCRSEILIHHDSSEREQIDRAIQRQLVMNGYDAYQDMIAVLSIDGQQWCQLLGCGKYGDKWYLVSFGGIEGVYLGLSVIEAGLIPISDLPDC